MEDTSTETHLGSVENFITKMKVSVVKKSDGKREIRLFTMPKDGRRTGELLMLNPQQFEELKKLIAAVDAQLKI